MVDDVETNCVEHLVEFNYLVILWVMAISILQQTNVALEIIWSTKLWVQRLYPNYIDISLEAVAVNNGNSGDAACVLLCRRDHEDYFYI